jgi:ADP-ribose pyrophosphatase
MVEVVSSQQVFSGRAFSLRVDQIRLKNGNVAQWEVIEHTGGVAVVPLDAQGNVVLVRQYRHSVGETLLELPAGTVKIGEDPAVCAGRELQEEIGMAAAKLELLGEFYLAPGYSAELMRVYLATGLTPSTLPQDFDEDIQVERIPFEEAVRLAINGGFRDSKSVAGLLLAAHRR